MRFFYPIYNNSLCGNNTIAVCCRYAPIYDFEIQRSKEMYKRQIFFNEDNHDTIAILDDNLIQKLKGVDYYEIIV